MFKLSFLLLPAIVLTACQNTQAPALKQQKHIETIKPGAGITLNHKAPDSIRSAQFQSIALTIDEIYEAGQMSLQIIPSEGLSIFGGNDRKSFEMRDKTSHDWPVDVIAEKDGIYFLSVFAQANIEGVIENRNFSIRLDIGTITREMLIEAFPENGTLSKDGKSRVLEAVETIR